MHYAVARDSAVVAGALSANECGVSGRLPATRRADWRAGRLAARRAVAGVSGYAPDQIEIESRDDDAPRAFVNAGLTRQPLGLRLSLAHVSGRAIAAACGGALVGVDLECQRPLPRSWAAFFLTASEQRSGVDTLVSWVLKEAAWKAIGLTRADPFTSVELIWRDAEVVGICHAGVHRPARAVLWHPWRGFLAAAVAVPEAA